MGASTGEMYKPEISPDEALQKYGHKKGDGGKKVTNMIGHAVCRGENIPKLNHYQLKM